MESSRSARAAITHSCAPTGDDVPYFARNLVTMATIHVVNDQSPAHWIRFPSCLLLCSLLLPTCISSFCVYCQDHTTDRHLTTYSKHLMLPRKLSPLLPRACHVLRSNFCQLIMATLKQFYKHLLIDYDRHLTTYTEQFFSCFLLLQPSGRCFYLPPYSWRLPASYPVQQAPDSVCVSMGPGLSRALLYDFYCRFIFTVSLQEIHHFTA